MKYLKLFIIVLLAFGFSSCSKIIMSMYGMKTVDFVDTEKIEYSADNYDIPKENSYKINASYLDYITNLDSTYNQEKKNHLQPLQALYFDNSGKLISYHINCYAGGFPNLKWNRNNAFNCFPPTTSPENDTLFDFTKLSKYFLKLDNTPYISSKKTDYNIVIFWSIAMGRQSKRLIKLVKENAKLSDKTVNIIFVNDDDIYLK